MEKAVHIFRRFEEADAADVEENLRLTPEERIHIVLELQNRMLPDGPPKEFERDYRIAKLQKS